MGFFLIHFGRGGSTFQAAGGGVVQFWGFPSSTNRCFLHYIVWGFQQILGAFQSILMTMGGGCKICPHLPGVGSGDMSTKKIPRQKKKILHQKNRFCAKFVFT